MPVNWARESCDRRDDPVSGARIIQLTSAAAISNNIYGEQPYCSPDGERLIISRCQDFCFDQEGSLLIHSLPNLRTTMIVHKVKGVRGVFNNAWSGICYYWSAERVLMRINMMTLEHQEIYREEDPEAPLPDSSVSPDQRYIIGVTPRLTGPNAPVFQIIRFDMQTGTRMVIFEHPELCKHLQFNPIHGKQILIQNNRGEYMKADGSPDQRSATDTTLFVIDADGSNQRYVPVGNPHTAPCTGHECFLADTGKVLFTVGWNNAVSEYHFEHDHRYPTGNIFTARTGDEKPTHFCAPDYFCNHISASRDGKYFVADGWHHSIFKDGALQPCALLIGNLETGRYRVLVENTLASGGGNQCTHTHPYLTADNRHVIYNSDAYYGLPQVYAARLPEGFLASLD